MSERPIPHVAGVEHRFVDVGGLRLHVAQAGPADGPPVILEHGWPQNWYAWRRVIPLLAARGFRVYAPDLRGFGWSDAPATTYAKSEFADDLVGLIKALDLTGVRLAGHDWGGFTAFLVALRIPERLHSLSAFSITAPWSAGRPSVTGAIAVLFYQPLLATPVVGAAVQRRTPFISVLYRIAGGKKFWSAAEREVFTAQFRDPARAEAASRVYRSFLTKELRAGAPEGRLTVPATLTVGERDPVISPSLLRGTESRADDLTIDYVDGAGHFLPEERPELVADRIASA